MSQVLTGKPASSRVPSDSSAANGSFLKFKTTLSSLPEMDFSLHFYLNHGAGSLCETEGLKEVPMGWMLGELGGGGTGPQVQLTLLTLLVDDTFPGGSKFLPQIFFPHFLIGV